MIAGCSKYGLCSDFIYMFNCRCNNFDLKAIEMKREKTSTGEFEIAAAEQDRVTHVLRLYVAGMTMKSTQAIANVRKLCEKYLAGRYELEVIDIYQQPQLAREEQIIATPTLIRKLPLPLRRLIGDMSDTAKFLVGIGLQPRNLIRTNP
jgi:circadian clock protein KaiB